MENKMKNWHDEGNNDIVLGDKKNKTEVKSNNIKTPLEQVMGEYVSAVNVRTGELSKE